jgi:putative hydrolase of the HAD superfamily
MLQVEKIKAISLDLDDTLWPIWPTIERAELALHSWLSRHAAATAAMFSSSAALRALRLDMERARPDLLHDMSALRRESIRLALTRAGDAPHLAEPAFEVFFAARQDVELYEDVLPALQQLARRYPLVAVSNGNADVQRVGLGGYFKAALSAHSLGVAKPDPRIFEAAADAVGVQAHEVLHVGDDAALDVLGALDAGMQTVWVSRAPDAAWAHGQQPHLRVANLAELCAALRSPR